jgi:hypothetical protein
MNRPTSPASQLIHLAWPVLVSGLMAIYLNVVSRAKL